MDGSVIESPRLISLRAKLAASTDHTGAPKPNYAERVAAIRAEIARLEGSANG